MRIKSYIQFINEAISEDLSSKITDKFKDIKVDLLELITKSIKTESLDLIKSFLEDYIKDDSKSSIEGLVNDADIYQFYIKYTNDIDEILEKGDELKKSPIEIDSFGLHDYVVQQTRKGIKELSKQLLSDLEGNQQTSESLMFWKNRNKDKGKLVVVDNPVADEHDYKSIFVYQLLEKVENGWKAALIGDIKHKRFNLWHNSNKKLGTVTVKRHFMYETISEYQELNDEQKSIVKTALDKIKDLGREDFVSVKDIIKRITKVEPII